MKRKMKEEMVIGCFPNFHWGGDLRILLEDA